MTVLQPAYVGLGSNLEDPVAQIGRAFAALAEIDGTRLVARSPLYRTRPLGPADQPDFVNAAAGLLTTLDPQALLGQLQAIENAQGRRRERRWGPRTLDLDLLAFGQQRFETRSLTLPHPGVATRAFVLRPLADIAPSLQIPGLGTVSELAARVGSDGVERHDGARP